MLETITNQTPIAARGIHCITTLPGVRGLKHLATGLAGSQTLYNL